MISSTKLHNIALCISFVVISVTFLLSSAYPTKYQINDSQHKRMARSLPDSYYDDSMWQQNLEPILSDHSFLRSAAKRAAAMGVDLPDYILHYKGNNWPNLGTFREKMQKSGK